MSRAILLCLALQLTAGGLTTADAAIVTSSFTGTVTAVNEGGQSGSPIAGGIDGIQVGSTFSGFFSYDTAGASSDLDDSTNGYYQISPSSQTVLSVTINGKTFRTAAGSGLAISTYDDVASSLSNTTDLLDINSPAPDLPAGWTATMNSYNARAVFADATGMALPDDSLPEGFSSDWTEGAMAMGFLQNLTTPSGSYNDVYIGGDLTATAVPEPSSVLALVSVVGCVLARRRFSHSPC